MVKVISADKSHDSFMTAARHTKLAVGFDIQGRQSINSTHHQCQVGNLSIFGRWLCHMVRYV